MQTPLSALPKPLNIIGCGHLGQTLGYLWRQADVFFVQGVVNTSLANSQRAASFISKAPISEGSDQEVTGLASISALSPAPVYQITASDHQIAACAKLLANSALIRPGDVVFHCSGAYSADELLAPLKDQGAIIASLHPASSFASPEKAITQFQGTHCVIEGDDEAVRLLSQAVEVIGGIAVALRPENKVLYHAAAVFASNYLTTLLDAAFSCGSDAGLSAEEITAILRPLATATLENNFTLGTAQALTGPIARGDTALVEKQMEALAKKSPARASLYAQLGLKTTTIAVRNKITAQKQKELLSLLETKIAELSELSVQN